MARPERSSSPTPNRRCSLSSGKGGGRRVVREITAAAPSAMWKGAGHLLNSVRLIRSGEMCSVDCWPHRSSRPGTSGSREPRGKVGSNGSREGLRAVGISCLCSDYGRARMSQPARGSVALLADLIHNAATPDCNPARRRLLLRSPGRRRHPGPSRRGRHLRLRLLRRPRRNRATDRPAWPVSSRRAAAAVAAGVRRGVGRESSTGATAALA